MNESELREIIQSELKNFFASESIVHHLRRINKVLARDLDLAIRTESTRDAARFVIENIPISLQTDHETMRYRSVTQAAIDGMFLEFGVFRGRWINFLAEARPDVIFYGFDSFTGLPQSYSHQDKGGFDLGGELPEVRENVRLFKGWFHETLPKFLLEHNQPVSFIHMDCDLWTSTITVLEHLRYRLRSGTQIVLDDFMLQPGVQKEEPKAFFDFMEAHKIRWEYTGFCQMSASVVLTFVPPSP